jgi:hypothetical protein
MALKAGADIAFFGGNYCTSVKQAKQACKEIASTPVLLNMVKGGLNTKYNSCRRSRFWFPHHYLPELALSQVMVAITGAMKELKKTGTVKKDNSTVAKPLSPRVPFRGLGAGRVDGF